MTNNRKMLACAVTLVGLALGTSSCGTAVQSAESGVDTESAQTYGDDIALGPATASDRESLFGWVRQRNEGILTIQYAENLAQWLPNQQFAIDGAEPEPLSDLLVRGRVVAAAPGPGYYVPDADKPGADAESGTETTFDDPRVMWAVVVMTIDPEEISGDSPDGPIKVALGVGGESRYQSLRGAGSLGEVVAVLYDDSERHDFAPGIYSVANLDTLLGVVEPDGKVVFPALPSPPASDKFLDGVDTWEEIAAAAAEDEPVIEQG